MATIRPVSTVEPYVRALGEDEAIRFLLAFGGTPVSLSARPSPDNAVVAVVGVQGALALHEEFGLKIPRVPLAKPWIAKVWFARGRSILAIARDLHAADKTVRGWLVADRAGAIERAEERRIAKAAEAAAQVDLLDWIDRRP